MTALRVARLLIEKHGERGVELATNRYLHWYYWTLVKPSDLTAGEKADFWKRTSFRAHTMFVALSHP